jgi:hypothetical protein
MAFPHASASSAHLAEVVTLPERTSSASGAERGGRRRRARAESTDVSSSDPAKEGIPS